MEAGMELLEMIKDAGIIGAGGAGFPTHVKLAAKADADVVISWKGDPILALGTYGEGRSFAWASDCAPHWMPADFCGSDCNRMLWERVLNWVTKRSF